MMQRETLFETIGPAPSVLRVFFFVTFTGLRRTSATGRSRGGRKACASRACVNHEGKNEFRSFFFVSWQFCTPCGLAEEKPRKCFFRVDAFSSHPVTVDAKLRTAFAGHVCAEDMAERITATATVVVTSAVCPVSPRAYFLDCFFVRLQS